MMQSGIADPIKRSKLGLYPEYRPLPTITATTEKRGMGHKGL